MKTIIEPFRIKSVEPIRITTAEQRHRHLVEASYNLFRIAARHVMIDLLTDSGTGAMSSEQWAGIMRGDESYAGADSYHRFLGTVRRITGFDNVLPTHQGRASERILFQVLLGSPPAGCGRIVPNNAHFDTTRANIEHCGAEAVDLLTDLGRCPTEEGPFKGNLDVTALERLLTERADDVPLVVLTVTCNTNGGQPVSLENLRAVRDLCDRFGKPLYLDAARFAENAWFIKQREPGQGARSPRDIVLDMFSLADGAMISAKKDGLVNIGGVLLVRDPATFAEAGDLLILTEGFVTYGVSPAATWKRWRSDSPRCWTRITCGTASARWRTSARSSSPEAFRPCVRRAGMPCTSTPPRSARTSRRRSSPARRSPRPCTNTAACARARSDRS